MDERLKIPDEKKEQLLKRVKEALDDDILNLVDWMAIYDIMLEACEREKADVFEQYMIERMKGDSEE